MLPLHKNYVEYLLFIMLSFKFLMAFSEADWRQ